MQRVDGQVDKEEFFREATIRICGSLELEKALRQCLSYIARVMPAEHMGLLVYDESPAMLEVVAVANADEGRAMSLKIFLTSELSRQVRELHGEQVQVFDRLRDSDVASLVMSSLGQTWGAGIVLRLIVEGKLIGALTVNSRREREFTHEHARLLALLNDPFAIALANSLAYREVLDLKERLADDKQYLQEELRRTAGDEIIGVDFGLRKVMELVRHVAPLRSPVLLLGETGTGKEMIACAIHDFSPRKDGPFIKINCGALPSTLMDTELFGHEKGAFTGALSLKRGRFERAHKGSIFLDEVAELTPEAQIRLLRVLQEKEIERVGGTSSIKVDIRVIAATHRNLEAMVQEGTFREDLYFRLKVFPIVIPPLRERALDIPTLVQHFLRKKTAEMGRKHIPSLAPGAIERLMSHHWSGNVRELENVIERALILGGDQPLSFDDLELGKKREPTSADPHIPPYRESMSLEAVISAHIGRVLHMTGGKVEGPGGAARILEVKPSTLRQKMRKLGIPFGRKARLSS